MFTPLVLKARILKSKPCQGCSYWKFDGSCFTVFLLASEICEPSLVYSLITLISATLCKPPEILAWIDDLEMLSKPSNQLCPEGGVRACMQQDWYKSIETCLYRFCFSGIPSDARPAITLMSQMSDFCTAPISSVLQCPLTTRAHSLDLSSLPNKENGKSILPSTRP